MSQIKYTLEGLGCANCAAKIEREVAAINDVTSAHVDFVTKTLTIEAEEHTHKTIAENASKIIASIENEVKMVPQSEDKSEDHKKSSTEAMETILSLVFFAAGIVTELVHLPLWLTALFLGLSTVLAGYRVGISGIRSLFKLRLDENALMTIAVVAAFALGEFREAAMVAILFRIGELLEDRAVENSRKGIENLAQIRPDTAHKLADAGEQTVKAEDVSVGERILVHPFERVPLDGVVVSGVSTLDTSALTGESLPVEAEPGLQVMSGMMNGQGMLTVEVNKGYSESAATRILEMVESAAARKGHAEKLITRFAAIYTPAVLAAAVLLATLPPLFGLGAFTVWLYRALIFLVASCPCALVISVPLGFYAGIGAASKAGVLVKGGRYIEALSRARAVVFDKTGTLTSGELSVTAVHSAGTDTEDELLTLAAAAEQYSSHPAAKAILKAAGDKKLPKVENPQEIPGLGVRGVIAGKEILCGRKKLITDNGIDPSALPEASVYIAVNGTAVGTIVIADTARADAPKGIKKLKALGVGRIAMLTGDARPAAEKIAQECGVTEVHAGLLPGDKVDIMEKIRSESGITVFVGDGINDAPVLAAADCGVAMGLGSDAAIEAADIVLTADKPSRLADAIGLFRRIMRVIRFNIWFALIIKAAVLVLAAVGYAPMWAAVFADTGVALLSVLNAARMIRFKA